MDFAAIAQSLHDSGLGEYLRSSLKALPIIEAIHVMALATVFGTIFIVDLRLIGYPNTRRAFTRLSDEMLRWTWAAFALAVITGVLLFIPNAPTYYDNTAFRLKMLALIVAGVNMAIFQFITIRTVAHWDTDTHAPWAARIAGIISILTWTTVIFLGRWIGFTKGYDFDIPEETDIDFDFSAVFDALSSVNWA